DFILRDFPEESCFWDSCHGDFGGTDGVASQYNQPMQYTPESNPTSSTSNEKDKKTKKASREKKTKTKKTEKPVDYPILRSLLENKKQRKKRPLKQVTYTDYQQEEIEKIINENIEIIEKKSQEKVSYEKTTRIKTDQIDFGIWNAQRLSNIRRRDHKLKDKNVYSPITLSMYINGEFQKELFQKRLRKSIEDFSAQLSSEIEKNALWYFIASGSTNITTKYKDLLGIREIFRDINKTHKKMVEGLRGYYPGVIDDMIAYLENHQPMRIIKSRPQAEWKESLGDIHIREYFKPNYYI
ncbi:hypothetical protein NEMIN01_2515, partial [Nematocida minor]|uniref:uncharacterized protein n=1 Tax=Nematocida minor TaxID=1912983 RepID=UPI0022204467